MFKKKRKSKADTTVTVAHEQLPNEYLSWSESKQRDFVRDLLRSISPDADTSKGK